MHDGSRSWSQPTPGQTTTTYSLRHTPPFQEWIQETRSFLSINNYEFIRQMDYALQSDREISLQDVTDSTTRGRKRREDLTVNERAQDLLQDELNTAPADRRAGRTDAAIQGEIDVLRNAYPGLETAYNDVLDRVSGFLKRALAQTCFRVWYQVRFLRRIFGHSWGFVYGEGGAPGTVPLHNLRVTSHVLHQEAPLGWYRVRLF